MNVALSDKKIFDPLKDDSSSLPNEAGFYMIAGRNSVAVHQLLENAAIPEFGGYEILYVGISSKQGLRKRDFKNHFYGTARNSTLRKSLGALFLWENCREYYADGRYRFNKKREDELSEWMKNNLIMLYWINIQEFYSQGLEKYEREIIDKLDPPLNIRNNNGVCNSAFRHKLKRLRTDRM